MVQIPSLPRATGPLRYTPFIVASIVLTLVCLNGFINPTMPHDALYRLARRDMILFPVGTRLWLPALQAHLFLLNQTNLPVLAYQLIPFTYVLAGLFLVNLLSNHLIGTRVSSLIFCGMILVALVSTWSFAHYTYAPYQEMLLYPVLLGLLYIHYVHPQRIILWFPLWMFVMLTREYGWIYWGVFCLPHSFRSDIPLTRRTILASLGVIPCIWLYSTGTPFLLSAGQPNIMPSWSELSAHLWATINLAGHQIIIPYAFFTVLAVITLYVRIRTEGRPVLRNSLLMKFTLFSFCSLGLIYGYMASIGILTGRNTRVLLPLLWHLPVLFLVLFRESQTFNSRCGVTLVRGITICVLGYCLITVLPRIEHTRLRERQVYLSLVERGVEICVERATHTYPPRIGVVDPKSRNLGKLLPVLVQYDPAWMRKLPQESSYDILLIPMKRETPSGYEAVVTMEVPSRDGNNRYKVACRGKEAV